MRPSEFSKIYQDLLGTRFVDGGRDPKTGLDCLGIVRVYLTRVRTCVPTDAFPIDQTETSAEDALGWVEGDCSRWWDRIGDAPGNACLLGDVVFTIAANRPHVSVLVYPFSPRLLLSSSLHRGAYTIPLDRAARQGEPVGVYRLRYEARPAARTAAA